MEASAQLNARMSKELKSAGDKRLAEAGISPTKLIRLVWEKAASGSEGLRQLLAVLQSDETQGLAQHDEGTNTHGAMRGEQFFTEGMKRLGISQPVAECVSANSSWKNLREETIASRLEERGVL